MENTNKAIDFKAAAVRLRAPNPTLEELAESLAQQYELENAAGLTQLIRDIEREPGSPMPAKELPSMSEELLRRWDYLEQDAKHVVHAENLLLNPGLPHGLLRIRSAQWGEKVVEALNVLADTPRRAHLLTPHVAVLRSLLMPLLYFNLENLREDAFAETSSGPVLIKGSPGAFVTDALALAGWEFTAEEIASEYGEARNSVYAQLTSEEGEVPVGDDAEAANDTEPLGETGWLEGLLHSYWEAGETIGSKAASI